MPLIEHLSEHWPDRLFQALVWAPVLYYLFFYKSGVKRVPMNFDYYRKHNPDHVKDGKVKCVCCGGTRIWCRSPYIVNGKPQKYNGHICSTCGEVLYYSITPKRLENRHGIFPYVEYLPPRKRAKRKLKPGEFL